MNDMVEQVDGSEQLDFETFYGDHFARAVGLAHLLVGSDLAADDIAQDALLRVGPKLSRVRNPSAYLNMTVVNLARNWHRGQRRREARERQDLRLVSATGSLDADDRHDELLALVDRLPFRQRTVLVARYWLDLPESEIADLVGCRPGTVKSLSSRALDTLRKELP